MICPFYFGKPGVVEGLIYFGVKVFLLIWVVFVPIVITSRLERIIKLLEEKK